MIGFSWRLRSWTVLFDLLLDQFVSSFVCANVLLIFKIDAICFIWFSTMILIDGFCGLRTIFLSSIYLNPRSRFMLGVDDIVVSIFSFETHCSNSAASLAPWWFQRCCSSSEISCEDQVCKNTGSDCMFGTLFWLFPPAWDAVEITRKVGFIVLSWSLTLPIEER